MPKVVITGAYGKLGGAVVRNLLADKLLPLLSCKRTLVYFDYNGDLRALTMQYD